MPNAAFLPPSLLPSFLFAPDKIYGSWYLRAAECLGPERKGEIANMHSRLSKKIAICHYA